MTRATPLWPRTCWSSLLALVAGAALLGGCDQVYRYAATRSPGDAASADGGADGQQVDSAPLPFGCAKLLSETGELAAAQRVVDDDFESQPLDEYPAGWANMWSGQDARVTRNVSSSGNQVFELTAGPAWARYDGVPFPGTEYRRACYEMRVMITHSEKPAEVGFAWPTSGSTTGHYGAVRIGASAGAHVEGVWYHVVAALDFAASACTYWIDETPRAPTTCGTWPEPLEIYEGGKVFFFVGVGNFNTDVDNLSVVYFDDVRLYALPISP